MWRVTCGDGSSVNSQPDLSCSPAVGAVPLRRRQQRGHRHRRQGGCSAPAGARPSGCQDMRGRQSGLWPCRRPTAPHSALNMHQLHAVHWSGSGHNNISAGSERTPPRNASSAQTNPALRAGVSRVVRRKAPNVASFFGARPLGGLWDGAFCGSAPSFPVRRRTVRSEVADRRDRDLVITVETVISEVAQFITCCKCKTFLELHSY